MFGSRSNWLPARAEPVWFNAYRSRNEESEGFSAILDVQWRVHIDGRAPYDLPQRCVSSPLWTIEGDRHGRRWFHPRLRATHGLLREIGVPCRVHPEQPDKLDIDWSAAYDEHEPAWDRMDAVAKGVAKRRDGPLGKVLAPIEYLRLPNYSTAEQSQIEREAAAEAARIDRSVGIGLPPGDTNTLIAEGEEIQAEIKERKRLRKHGIKGHADVLGIDPPTQAGSWLYTLHLQVLDPRGGTRVVQLRMGMNDAMVQQVRRKGRVSVRIDPDDPNIVALVIS
jgi:hypothetical protein